MSNQLALIGTHRSEFPIVLALLVSIAIAVVVGSCCLLAACKRRHQPWRTLQLPSGYIVRVPNYGTY